RLRVSLGRLGLWDPACSASPPPDCRARRATARPSSGAESGVRESAISRLRSQRWIPLSAARASETVGEDERERAKREGGGMRTAALITHSHPPAATQ